MVPHKFALIHFINWRREAIFDFWQGMTPPLGGGYGKSSLLPVKFQPGLVQWFGRLPLDMQGLPHVFGLNVALAKSDTSARVILSTFVIKSG